MQYICQYPILRVIARFYVYLHMCATFMHTIPALAFSIYNIRVCTFLPWLHFFEKKVAKIFADSKKSITFASENQTNH